MDVLLPIVGVLLAAVVLWEVFNDLFHPAGTSALTDWLGRSLFNAFKRRPILLPLAGPLAVVLVIATWVAGLIVGFALSYLPAYPAGFRNSVGAVPPGAALDAALHDFAATLDKQFMKTRSNDRERIFEAFSRDHLSTTRPEPDPASGASGGCDAFLS